MNDGGELFFFTNVNHRSNSCVDFREIDCISSMILVSISKRARKNLRASSRAVHFPVPKKLDEKRSPATTKMSVSDFKSIHKTFRSCYGFIRGGRPVFSVSVHFGQNDDGGRIYIVAAVCDWGFSFSLVGPKIFIV